MDHNAVPCIAFYDELSFAFCARSYSIISLLQYLDGKNRSGCCMSRQYYSTFRLQNIAPLDRTLGILSLCSLSALTLHTIATMPNNTAPMIAVFCFQFAG